MKAIVPPENNSLFDKSHLAAGNFLPAFTGGSFFITVSISRLQPTAPSRMVQKKQLYLILLRVMIPGPGVKKTQSRFDEKN
ncbi:MAG: hypothetical protein K9K64_14155 [Desulfohalobiaceae bacterium]|nr:hypothetical protein [Desulfohalobiaceae bacterium]